jgi:alpha-D-ribose 1-methylphosphonate 5-phosphate C-P lyase
VLDGSDMRRVGVLAGLLRVAEYLERSKAQRVREVRCHAAPGYVQIEARSVDDATVEVREADAHADLLASALSATVDVVQGIAGER